MESRTPWQAFKDGPKLRPKTKAVKEEVEKEAA